MTLTELRYIVAVAKEKQFCKAAKTCYVSQPTLSLGIKKLEEDLGVVLFERKHQELVITPVGRKIVEQAERVLKEVRAIKELAQLDQDPLSEPLKLGAIHTVGPYLFPDLLPVVKENAPKLPLLVQENYTGELTRKLKNGDIDAALVSLPYDEPGIDAEILYEEPFVILVPSSHPLAMTDSISVKQLAKESVLLLGPQHCFRDQVMALCQECFRDKAATDDIHNAFEGSSLETIRFMVAGGVGVTIVPRMAACADRYAQRLIAIKHFTGISPSRKIALAWRKNFTRMEAINMLAQCIRDCSLGGATVHKSKTRKTYAPAIAGAPLGSHPPM
ncbi:MAG TPA: hydrogen peroxide-inducible genes activator [Gammaproteobacteria bacterium]